MAAWTNTQRMVTIGVGSSAIRFLLDRNNQAKVQRWLEPSLRYWCGMQAKQLEGDYWLYLLREVHAVNEAALKYFPCGLAQAHVRHG